MTEILMVLGVFVAGLAIGFGIAAVTETRVERKLDRRFWALQDDIEGKIKDWFEGKKR